MPSRLVKKTYTLFTATIAFAMLACADSSSDVGADKLEPIEAGASKASLLEAIGTGPLTAQFADTLRLESGFRRNTYLIAGKQYEVLFYRELPGNVAEPVEQAKETPVVLQDGKVLGWGWRFYVEEGMKELKLPSPLDAPVDPNAEGLNKGALQTPGAPAPTAPTDSTAKGDSAAAGPKA